MIVANQDAAADGNSRALVASVLGSGAAQSNAELAGRVARVLSEPNSEVRPMEAGRPAGDAPKGSDASSHRPTSTAFAGKALTKDGNGPRVPIPAESGEVSEFDKLVRSMRLRLGEARSSARLQLNPPELGRVTVDVRMSQGTLEIDVRTESHSAKAIMQERAAELRFALENQGIPVDRFDVRLETRSEHGLNGNFNDRASAESGRQGSDGSGFSMPEEVFEGEDHWTDVHEWTGAGADWIRRLDVRV